MRHLLITTFIAAPLFAAGAMAQDVIVRDQAPNEVRMDWITGSNITSPDGESVGEVKDIIVDQETGQVTAAIVGIGGFFGLGEKQIAVDWSQLQIDYDGSEITLNLTKEQAEGAGEYVFRDKELPPPPADTTAVGTEPLVGTGAVVVPETEAVVVEEPETEAVVVEEPEAEAEVETEAVVVEPEAEAAPEAVVVEPAAEPGAATEGEPVEMEAEEEAPKN